MKKLITIDEVCEIARMSKPTIYRKIKSGDFPKPIKVPTTANRGPKLVNRWDEKIICDHMLLINLTKAKDAELIVITPPEETDEHWHEDIPPAIAELGPWYKKNKHLVLAAVGGLLAGLAVWVFKG
tara:strand:+ start:721 stop:1098 length:378 start_codon:yes stop_codon:yes gene_type:complete